MFFNNFYVHNSLDSSSVSKTTPNFEKNVKHLGHIKASGFLFHNFPPVPHTGHLSESIVHLPKMWISVK